MTSDDVIAQLEKAGSAPTRTTYGRHGITSPMFGASYAVLSKLAKSIKVEVDHGDTACVTPNADTYIAKIWARKKA